MARSSSRPPLGLFPGERAPRLYDRTVETLRVRHDSRRTEEAYVHWITRFIGFHERQPLHELRSLAAAGEPRARSAKDEGMSMRTCSLCMVACGLLVATGCSRSPDSAADLAKARGDAEASQAELAKARIENESLKQELARLKAARSGSAAGDGANPIPPVSAGIGNVVKPNGLAAGGTIRFVNGQEQHFREMRGVVQRSGGVTVTGVVIPDRVTEELVLEFEEAAEKGPPDTYGPQPTGRKYRIPLEQTRRIEFFAYTPEDFASCKANNWTANTRFPPFVEVTTISGEKSKFRYIPGLYISTFRLKSELGDTDYECTMDSHVAKGLVLTVPN